MTGHRRPRRRDDDDRALDLRKEDPPLARGAEACFCVRCYGSGADDGHACEACVGTGRVVDR